MPQTLIEELVIEAQKHEVQTSALLNRLEQQMLALPRSIALPKVNPAVALKAFVVEYISHVPSFIGAVSIAAVEAGIDSYVSPFLEVATNFLLSPKGESAKTLGYLELMEQAYLAHRLIEEVNDQYIVHAGIPLIPMDVTKANIIVHHLLGETLANSLDDVVEETARQMTSKDIVYSSEKFKKYVEIRKGKGWDQVWKQWSDMTRFLEVDLSLKKGQL
ncbi:MAG: hypothetical protein ACI95C_001898 [Pseudohongiellaceae bacterium]|jgi:hypothetical protein